MSETKPTAGALRAADRIRDLLEDCGSLEISNSTIGATPFQEEVAHIIDREIGGPKVEELLEAAKDAQAVIGLFAHGRGLDSREASTQKRLEQAIREVSAALGGKAE